MNDFQDGHTELDDLFAAARELTPTDLGAADRFLAGQAGRRRQSLRLWASTALGLAAALGGLTVLRPAPTELPASAAYSVYQAALGDGW
ncbi:hypothetical protein [Deinococcus sp.]|uniref:hypothetical protein n=1 Tax=Deinococcus sp. TaxID=47478 RepID=UPI003C7AC0F3